MPSTLDQHDLDFSESGNESMYEEETVLTNFPLHPVTVFNKRWHKISSGEAVDWKKFSPSWARDTLPWLACLERTETDTGTSLRYRVMGESLMDLKGETSPKGKLIDQVFPAHLLEARTSRLLGCLEAEKSVYGEWGTPFRNKGFVKVLYGYFPFKRDLKQTYLL